MNGFTRELATELVLFSVDALLSFFFLKSYNRVGRYINSLQEVSAKGANVELENDSDGKTKFAMVHGSVVALGNTIPSMHVPNTSGVVQKLNTSELVMTRNSSGFWRDDSRSIHQSLNTVPFAIIVGKLRILVEDVELADELHLDTVYNNYDRTVHSLAGNLWSFFLGIRQYGVQTTEEMLKEGTTITAIGDLIHTASGSLIRPPDDNPYIITTQPVSSLLRGLRDRRILFGTLLIITGGVTVVFGSLLGYRLLTILKNWRDRRETQRRINENRKTRRQNVRDDELPDHMRCVVCQENPREIILLPCGHVCLCEDCSQRVTNDCPVCRTRIRNRSAAFL